MGELYWYLRWPQTPLLLSWEICVHTYRLLDVSCTKERINGVSQFIYCTTVHAYCLGNAIDVEITWPTVHRIFRRALHTTLNSWYRIRNKSDRYDEKDTPFWNKWGITIFIHIYLLFTILNCFFLYICISGDIKIISWYWRLQDWIIGLHYCFFRSVF